MHWFLLSTSCMDLHSSIKWQTHTNTNYLPLGFRRLTWLLGVPCFTFDDVYSALLPCIYQNCGKFVPIRTQFKNSSKLISPELSLSINSSWRVSRKSTQKIKTNGAPRCSRLSTKICSVQVCASIGSQQYDTYIYLQLRIYIIAAASYS